MDMAMISSRNLSKRRRAAFIRISSGARRCAIEARFPESRSIGDPASAARRYRAPRLMGALSS